MRKLKINCFKPLFPIIAASMLSTVVHANNAPLLMANGRDDLLITEASNDTGLTVDEIQENTAVVMYANTRVNFRTDSNTSSDIIETINSGTAVNFLGYVTVDQEIDGWSMVAYNNATGYIKSEYLSANKPIATVKSIPQLLNWSEVKNIFTIGVAAEVYDIRSGLTYYVKSFSNGLHADVEPVTKEDTAILKKTFNGVWSWDVRPVLVTINGYSIVGSINGMPHGGGVNSSNGMDGQVCIHFRGSSTHNGNTSFERVHQNAITEGWNYYK